MQLYFILSLIVAILIIIFAIANAAPVPVSFLFVEYQLSLALIIFLSAALGAIITVLLGLVKHLMLKRQIRSLQIENEKYKNGNQRLEKDIELLKETVGKNCEKKQNANENRYK